MPPLADTGGLISSGLKPRGGGAFGSGGGMTPDRSSSRDASIAACICAGVGRLAESLPTKPSITLRWRSTAARSNWPCLVTSMVLVARFGSAPRLINALIASARFADAAKISGVCSHSASRALTSPLASASRLITSALPASAARWIGVAPLGFDFTLTSAPAFTSTFTTAGLAALAARWSGVYWPMRVTAPVLAPPYTSRSASSASPRSAAQCSALMPSPCAALTSAPCFSRSRIAALSPRAAASATGEAVCCAPSDAVRTNAIIRTKVDWRFIATPRKVPYRPRGGMSVPPLRKLRLRDRRRRRLRERQLAGGVAELLEVFHAEDLAHRQERIGHRRVGRGLDVKVALQRAVGAAEQDQRAAA